MIAEVIVDVLNKNVDKTYDYLIPLELEALIKVGSRVKVSFGPRKITGFVINIKNDSDFASKKLKPIDDIVDLYPLLSEELIELAKYMHKRYYSKMALCLNQMIPSALRMEYKKELIINDKEALSEGFKEFIKGKRHLVIDKTYNPYLKEINDLINNKALTLNTLIKTNLEKKTETSYLYLEDVSLRSKRSLELLAYLKEAKEPVLKSVIINDLGYSRDQIKKLVEAKAIKEIKEDVFESPKIIQLPNKRVELNESQVKALAKIDYSKSKTYLLHGVTGSGKTEVYLEAISKVLEMGKNAILLVPEISLTPQLTARFKARFNDLVAVLHSRLTNRERESEWRRIREKKARCVVGARSAIFAPVSNLGIIIIDEEHETSYIQEQMPCYNAKDIALWRSKYNNIPLILGSATPSLTDYYRAKEGIYTYLSLPNRATAKALGEAKIVDMRLELRRGNRSPISNELKEAIAECLQKHEQVILFLNRRGYSSSVMCRSCGEIIKCPNCDMALTYHQYNDSLKCHYCGYEKFSPSICPKCGSDKIRYVGTGTEKIEAALHDMFKEARILRMDRDTTQNKNSYIDIYESFNNHEADILIGTQMVAKGFDFPLVTLVGILNADMALFYPSYDATEVAFSLLEQVSGRSGRHKEGKIIMQTYNPDKDVIKMAAIHDYNGFYNEEIMRRKRAFNPPFCMIKKLSFKSENKLKALSEAKAFVKQMDNDKITLLGPTEAVYFKIKNTYTYDVFIKYTEDSEISYLNEYYNNYENSDVVLKIGDE